jgi:predicted transcriptional regulator
LTSRRDPASKQEAILDLVGRRPGIHKSEICRCLGMSWGAVSYHIPNLRKRGRLLIVSKGREARLFPPGIPAHQMAWMSRLNNEIDAAIIGHLINSPSECANDISQALGLGLQLIRRHLTTLTEEGLVKTEGEYARRFRLEPTVAMESFRDSKDLEAHRGNPGVPAIRPEALGR